MKKADAFLIKSGPAHRPDLKHLHAVCTNPDGRGNVLLVSITTWTNSLCDSSCILAAGDHKFISHKSWVLYRAAEIFCGADISYGIKSGLIIPMAAFRPAIFQRIYDGFLASPHTKPKIKKYLLANS